MYLLLLTIGSFLIFTLNAYRGKELKLSSRILHLFGVLIVSAITGSFLTALIENIFTDSKNLLNDNFVNIGGFNKYVVLTIWLGCIYLNLALISINLGISQLYKKSVKSFNKYIPLFIIFNALHTYLVIINADDKLLSIEMSKYTIFLFSLGMYIIEFILVLILFNNKAVRSIYRGGSIKEDVF